MTDAGHLVRVPVASIGELAVSKAAAWVDRYNQKDLEDVTLITSWGAVGTSISRTTTILSA